MIKIIITVLNDHLTTEIPGLLLTKSYARSDNCVEEYSARFMTSTGAGMTRSGTWLGRLMYYDDRLVVGAGNSPDAVFSYLDEDMMSKLLRRLQTLKRERA